MSAVGDVGLAVLLTTATVCVGVAVLAVRDALTTRARARQSRREWAELVALRRARAVTSTRAPHHLGRF
jgi:hypothetical protein